MIDINVNVNCPDLLNAAKLLSTALMHRGGGLVKDDTTPPDTAPMTNVVVNSAPVQTAPVQPAPVQPAPAPVAPVSPSPSITKEQLAMAGAALIRSNPAIQGQLMQLLQQFGVQSVMQVQPDQIGAFATAMRGMGAKI